MGKHVRVRTSEPPLAASSEYPGEGVALPRTPHTPHSNARDGRRKAHKSRITDMQSLSLLERRGGKTEHYTTGVQYELKTSLQVRPPPPVATGTSPRAPRNHTTVGYIAEIPYKPPGGYISPYKSPTRLDELGKLSREIPAPWDYAEAQIKAAPPPPGASMFSKSTENFSEDKWYRRTIFNAPELVDTTLKYPGPGAYDPVLNASSRSRRSPRATIGHDIPPPQKASRKCTALPCIGDAGRVSAEALVGRDVRPKEGLRVSLCRRQMKRWNIKEPGVGSIFEVDDSGSFCMVQWAPPYPAAEDEFTICPTGQNGEYWLATLRSPPPTPPAKRWVLDALVSPRYEYNVALGTYCIEHKHKQPKKKEKSRRGVRDYVLGSIIQEVKLMVLEEARARDQLENENKRRQLLLQKSQAAEDLRNIAIPGKGIWKTAADLENLREGANSQPFAWLFKDVMNGIKLTNTGHDGDFQSQIQDQLRNADLSLVTAFNALPLGDGHGPGTGKTQKEIKQLFDDADANGSGTICATEMKGLITACCDGQEPNDDDVVKALANLDKDANGSVDFGEFLKLIESFLLEKYDKRDVEKPIADDVPFSEAEMKLGNLERAFDAHKMLEGAHQPSNLKIHAARTNESQTVKPPPMLCRSESCTLIEGSALKQTKILQIQGTDEDSINLLRHQDPTAVKALRKASRSVLVKDNVHDTVFRHKKKHIPQPSPRQLRALEHLAKPKTLEDPTERPRARHMPRGIFNDTSRARFESRNRLVQHQQQAQVHESQVHIFREDAEGGSGDEINDGESGNENDLAHDHGAAPPQTGGHEDQEVCDENGSEGQYGGVMERSEGFAMDEAMAWDEEVAVSMPGEQDGGLFGGDGEGQTEGGYPAQEYGQVEECARSEAKGGVSLRLSHLEFADEIAALRGNRTRSISIADIGNSMDWPEAEQRGNREAEEAARHGGGEGGECREQRQKQRELVSRQSQGRARTGLSSPQDLRRTETPASASKTPPETTTPLNSQDARQQTIAVAVAPQREDELVISSNVDSGEPDTIE